MFFKIIRFGTLLTLINVAFSRHAEAQRPENAMASTTTLYDFKLNNPIVVIRSS